MSDPQPGTERPYQVDDAWSRAVFARRTGAGAAFFLRHLRPGMRLIDCGCGPGSITVDLAQWGCRGASMQKWPASVGGTAGLVVVLSASTDRYGCGSGA